MATVSAEQLRQEYLARPGRTSLIGHHVLTKAARPIFYDAGLWVDFELDSQEDLARLGKEFLQHEGLGVLAIIGSVSADRFGYEDYTWAIPDTLEQLGVPETPTVFIPLDHGEATNPRTQRVRFTATVDIAPFPLEPRKIIEAGAALAMQVVQQQ